MWQDFGGQLWHTLGSYVWRVAAALIILVIGIWLARVIKNAVHRVLVSKKVDPTLVGFTDSAIHVVLYGLVGIEVLHKLGVESSTLVAAVGAAGFAIGFALRGHLGNVAAGLLIILFRPFRIGEQIEGGGAAGTVEKIQLLDTEIRTADNLTVIVPNSKLMADKIVNYSHRDTRRLEVLVGVSYKADLKKVRDVLRSIIEKDDLILKEPPPNVTIKELADKSVKIEAAVWVRSRDYLKAKVQMNEKIKECFDSEEIPFP
ncbi:MAG: mechanosensitive ion channel [Deltaproteobacteria bacterium]|nr:mechanosensitive ion channel [Deltaproteobacteria bacterium]